MFEQVGRLLLLPAAAALCALLLSMGVTVLLRPWLMRHALVTPNSRSSHQKPTPQGGGIGVVVATLTVSAASVVLAPIPIQNEAGQFLTLIAATIFLAVIGAIDDMRSVPVGARFAAQCIAVLAVIASLPDAVRILPSIPPWAERTGLFVGGVWLVNLVNFMDGIDWMTIAEFVPITAAIVLLGLWGIIAPLPTLVAAALFGALVGFAPFNKPVAQMFLGDVGSLPLGLTLGWLLLQPAQAGHLAAALILPLYYIADATITLIFRLGRGDPIWRAHRTHFYQRATDNGFAVRAIIARIFLLNVGLAALALLSIALDTFAASAAAFVLALAGVAWTLITFAQTRR
jgi:UDP-N-acetylmuramyl pentapeptide phosphotransferase/UDP-N-acetylglucosamine-1-phosphate transferase